MRIAIIGSGISGLGAAWLLHRRHDITVYEAADRLGGHCNTVDVVADGRRVPVDTGFIVFNETTYPNLLRLFANLAVATEPSTMSFSVSSDGGAFEYAGNLPGLVAQRTNILRPRLWRMARDILRFYREAPKLLADPDGAEESLGDYLNRRGYSEDFVRDHLLPMGAAIWSSTFDGILTFPARTFVRFFYNHGLLQLSARPQWRTVTGGSRRYVERMAAQISSEIRLGTAVVSLRRSQAGVFVRDSSGDESRFDHAVVATHADQALAILGANAKSAERLLLRAFRYERNRAVLHRDVRLMPRRRAAWSSWNFMADRRADPTRPAAVTYWMNSLQNLDHRLPLFVTLNPVVEPDPALKIAEFLYDHPQFDAAAIAAQRQLPSIQGLDRTWFCGSYCGYGFHEDALQAGFAVAAALGVQVPWAGAVTPVSPAWNIATPVARISAAA